MFIYRSDSHLFDVSVVSLLCTSTSFYIHVGTCFQQLEVYVHLSINMLIFYQITGTPDETVWPDVARMCGYCAFKPRSPVPFSQIFTAAGDDLINLLYTLLSLDPDQRGTATSALASSYFRNRPAPTPEAELPRPKLNHSVAGTLQQRQRQQATVPASLDSLFNDAHLPSTPLPSKRRRET